MEKLKKIFLLIFLLQIPNYSQSFTPFQKNVIKWSAGIAITWIASGVAVPIFCDFIDANKKKWNWTPKKRDNVLIAGTLLIPFIVGTVVAKNSYHLDKLIK